MADYAISSANLSAIENNLSNIHRALNGLDSRVNTVSEHVSAVDHNINALHQRVDNVSKQLQDFVETQIRENRLGRAHTLIVSIRQEIAKKFGHHDVIRRTVTGILEANDLGIIRRETIGNATEELMITTPQYWLAPALVSLAAWINDDQDLAYKALQESMKRDDEKTSLFYALVSRRAERPETSLLWMQRYLAAQDEENLDRQSIVLLDAYACGLFGQDTEGIISAQLDEWIESLEERPGFVDRQRQQWVDAIESKRIPIPANEYPFLRQYSATWPRIETTLEGSRLHRTIYDFFTNIYQQPDGRGTLKKQLDGMLTRLVSDFDKEELPLRRQEKLEQCVIDFAGDEPRAKAKIQSEQSALDEHRDFTRLLTDAAMHPETSGASPSTQKFAMALSRDWIQTAYEDTVAQNRAHVPHEIEMQVGSFQDHTKDGENEHEILEHFGAHTEKERSEALDQCKTSMTQKGAMIGTIGLAALGILLMFWIPFFGVVALIGALIVFLNYRGQVKRVEAQKADLNAQFDERLKTGKDIIRRFMAEVVDMRRDFLIRDKESEKVIGFLEQISPADYVRRQPGSTRRIAAKGGNA